MQFSTELFEGPGDLLHGHSQPITPVKQVSWVCSEIPVLLHMTALLGCLVPRESRSFPGERETGDVEKIEPAEGRI